MADIEAEAVYRVVRNPEGLYSEQDGQYGYQLSAGRLPTTASASLPEEWSDARRSSPSQDVRSRAESRCAGMRGSSFGTGG